MIRRLLFVILFAIGGFVYYIPKWVLMGTKASRERRKLVKLTKKQNKLLREQARQQTTR